MRACIRCGNTSGYSLIGGSCITCEYDDSDCDELVAKGKAEAVDETVAAVVACIRKRAQVFVKGVLYFRDVGLLDLADAIERGEWKANEHTE